MRRSSADVSDATVVEPTARTTVSVSVDVVTTVTRIFSCVRGTSTMSPTEKYSELLTTTDVPVPVVPFTASHLAGRSFSNHSNLLFDVLAELACWRIWIKGAMSGSRYFRSLTTSRTRLADG